MKKNVLIIVAVIVLLVVGGGAFYGGMIFGKMQAKPAGFAGGNFQTRINRPGANGSNFISGNIISNSIFLKCVHQLYNSPVLNITAMCPIFGRHGEQQKFKFSESIKFKK